MHLVKETPSTCIGSVDLMEVESLVGKCERDPSLLGVYVCSMCRKEVSNC